MNIYTFKDAFLVGVFMSFMIGPVFFMLIKTSILKGARAAISFDLGVIFGDICFMLMAYFGSRSLLEKVSIIVVSYPVFTYIHKKHIPVYSVDPRPALYSIRPKIIVHYQRRVFLGDHHFNRQCSRSKFELPYRFDFAVVSFNVLSHIVHRTSYIVSSTLEKPLVVTIYPMNISSMLESQYWRLS